jgi:hypothetical protein
MNYFVNCPVASTGNIAVSKYIYSPSSNSSTGNSHYFPPGIYDVDINAYFYAIGSPTIASGSFVMGASTGTNIQAMPANSQYGVINIQSPTIPFANTGAINLNSQSFGYSHKGCFVLTSSAFINVEVFINSLTITGGNINMNVYGVVKRIG